MVAGGPNYMLRGLGLSVPPSGFQGREKGWKLTQLSMASDLINHNYVMEPP